jgi:hypothetical protein
MTFKTDKGFLSESSLLWSDENNGEVTRNRGDNLNKKNNLLKP